MIGIGIVGFGSMGHHHAERLLKGHRRFRFVAACDGAEGRRRLAQEQYGARPYSDLKGLLADEEVEVALVATPSNSHGPIAIEALRAGKHVVVEKPMCLNAREADRMIAAARKAGRVLSVFQNRRWDSDFRTVRRVVESGVLGRIHQIKRAGWGFSDVSHTYGVKEFRPQWRSEKTYGGGILYDFGAHCLDQLLQLVPSPMKYVFGDLRGIRWTTDADDFATIYVKFADGISAHVELSQASRATYNTGWLINGEEAGYENGYIVTGAPRKLHRRKVRELKRDWPAFYRGLYDALANGAAPPVDPLSVRRVMVLMDAVRKSTAENRVVAIHDDPGEP